MEKISFRKGLIALGFSMMLIVMFSGCTTTPTGNNTTNITGNVVVMQNFSFVPSVITINASESVTWVNMDSVSHQVVADNGLFTSAAINPGATYSFSFTTLGNYTYHCGIHPFMKGEVSVIGQIQNQTQNNTQNETNVTPPAPTPTSYTIAIQNFAFSPQKLAINGSANVTWVNMDNTYHRLLADNGDFESPILGTGENYTYTFSKTGNYTSHCAIHTNMTGEIDVYVEGQAPPAYEEMVVISNNSFKPQNVTVDAGDTIRWLNEDNATHMIVADKFSSPNLSFADDFYYTFNTPGVYTYADGYNVEITGKVTVLAVVSNQTNQTPPAQNATVMAIVNVSKAGFNPQTVTIYAGGMVEWVKDDNETYNMKSAIFAHNMSNGDRYLYQFDVPGTYNYWDDLNPAMNGTVIVIPSNETVTPPVTNETTNVTATIQITRTSYEPSLITIDRGVTVVWENKDTLSHYVVAKKYQSGEILPGGSFSRVFNTSGSYAFHDSKNPGMVGQIIVN